VVIAVGGIGTIVAVSLVCLFLVWVVVPLFLPVQVGPEKAVSPGMKSGAHETGIENQENGEKKIVALGIDDYRLTAWEIAQNGAICVFRIDNGQILQQLTAEQTSLTGISAVSVAIDGQSAAFGFADGHVQLSDIRFNYQMVPSDQLPPAAQKLLPGEVVKLDDGSLVARTEQGDFRRQKFELKLQPPLAAANAAISRLDYVTVGSDTHICTLSADGKLRTNLLAVTHSDITDKDQSEFIGADLPLPKTVSTPPDYVLVSDRGEGVFIAWNSGRLLRFSTRNPRAPRLEEEVHLVSESGHSLTALSWLLGRSSLVAGDTLGRIRVWFTKEIGEADRLSDDVIPPDHRVLVAAHEFAAEGHAVTSIAASPRSRLIAAGFADGQVKLLYTAAERTLAELKCPHVGPVKSLAISPKGNCLLACTAAGITRWNFDAQHPEATLGMLFLPVWYEGHPQPELAWESTGSDASEAKFGLMPLVFGTLKATVYTMLFGAPLALLAAIYSSEFLQPRMKSRIKPTIEMMASLPSVVLGFLAGLVVAPFIESVVSQALTCVFTVPLSFLLGAYVWQLLPSDVVVRLSRFRLLFIFLMMPLGIFAGIRLGPLVEQWLFAGDIKEWLDGQRGSGAGGWVLLLLPLTALFTAVLIAQKINPWLRRRAAHWSRIQAGFAELLKFIASVLFAITLSFLVAWALDALKLDPRGTFVGTYVQRNALVVGFAMGFAIIPLIYTIADDALSSVPEHLRSASLGAGATPWQTALRIVIPTAASGLFSALMIGLGRAVGETMIVLMAAGNTPLMDLNIFQGFETLSMALATELPEAAKNSTHYRVLFLAALTLFAVTFVVNTVAEIVRQRFRRRAYEL
jgi:phosphate transport system permease protein